MANCSMHSGMLFWKKACLHPSLGNCARCRRFVCQVHSAGWHDDRLLCNDCAHQEQNPDTDSVGSSAAAFAAGAALASLASSASSNESSPDSSSSDSGGGDSGGGSSDSGGSSSD